MALKARQGTPVNTFRQIEHNTMRLDILEARLARLKNALYLLGSALAMALVMEAFLLYRVGQMAAHLGLGGGGQ